MTARRAAVAGVLLLFCLLAAGPAAAAGRAAAPARSRQPTGANAPLLAPSAAPKATPTPAPTPTNSAGLTGGQLFLGTILVAVGVAGATLMLVLIRTLRKHPPPAS